MFQFFLIAFLLCTFSLHSQTAFDYPPLNYASTPINNDVEKLIRNLHSGKVSLSYDKVHGYLPDLLKALGISSSSQVLVFSKTSFQKEIINSKNPRALYYNSKSYVGMIPGGNMLEIASYDTQSGAVFYTLNQKKEDKFNLVRNDDDCLNCHSSARTQSVPGIMVRSIFLNKAGNLKTSTVTQRTPIIDRWGGWYVTGNNGKNKHLGNITANNAPDLKTDNIESLKGFFNTQKYLHDQSDIVSLMVLEHQAHMSNLITRLNFRSRIALYRQGKLNKSNNNPADYLSDYAKQEIARNADGLLRYLLFSEEAPLNSPLASSSQFAADFQKDSREDSKGRSLKDFDLKKRLFKYPCSYLIYSDHFQQLPKVSKEYLYKKLYEILSGKNQDKEFSHLTSKVRQSILEILRGTLKDLPAYWRL